MPLPFFNFGQLYKGPNNNGLGEIFENYQKGQEIAATPQKLAQERLSQQLQNSLLGENITGQQQRNKYYPQTTELDMQGKQFANTLDRLKAEQEPERFAGSQKLNQAQIANYLAQAQQHEAQANNPTKNMTPAQKELWDIAQGDPALYQKLLKQKHGYREGIEIRAGGVPLQSMDPGARIKAREAMRSASKEAQGLIKVNKVAQEMKDLVAANPGMGGYFARAILDTSEKPTKIAMLARQFLDKDQITALNKFSKLTAQ